MYIRKLRISSRFNGISEIYFAYTGDMWLAIARPNCLWQTPYIPGTLSEIPEPASEKEGFINMEVKL